MGENRQIYNKSGGRHGVDKLFFGRDVNWPLFLDNVGRASVEFMRFFLREEMFLFWGKPFLWIFQGRSDKGAQSSESCGGGTPVVKEAHHL